MTEYDAVIGGGMVVDGMMVPIVNGTVTFEDGKCTGATSGKLLRYGG